jgi:hypothetical protein
VTPSADGEILAEGRPIRVPLSPVSPTGCPTPAVVTRAVRERFGFDPTIVDAGPAEYSGGRSPTWTRRWPDSDGNGEGSRPGYRPTNPASRS